MNEQYFAQNPTSESRPVSCVFSYRGCELRFLTDSGVFSRGEVDYGTALLLNTLPDMRGEVLDLGCGWGAMGVAVAKKYPDTHVVMSDVNERALALARRNLRENRVTADCVASDGFAAVDGQFDAILFNPPIRAGKDVVYRLFSQAAAHLKEDGCLYIVIRKQQGADSALKFLKEHYEQAEIMERSAGYRVLRCMRGIRE